VAAGEAHPGGTTDHGGTGTAVARPESEELPVGAVVTASGRISQAVEFEEPSRADQPFSPVQLARLDEALTLASRDTGLRFSVYLGDLGPDPSARVAELHGQLEDSVRRGAQRGRGAHRAARPRGQARRHEHGRLVQGGRPARRAAERPSHAGRPGGRAPPRPLTSGFAAPAPCPSFRRRPCPGTPFPAGDRLLVTSEPSPKLMMVDFVAFVAYCASTDLSGPRTDEGQGLHG
jgi:hypothetical protein